MTERPTSTIWGVAVLAAVTVTACGGDGEPQLTIFAASSLADVFAELEGSFEAEHPGVDVVLSTGGSSSLAAQLEGGAPADVFAAADTATMQRVLESDATDASPVVFATNRLTIAVEPGNPLGIERLADLEDADATIVLAAPEVPAGAYAAQLLDGAGVSVDVASYEQSVRSVASKVALGEADIGIVYQTDVLASDGDLAEVPIPDEQQITAVYPIVVMAGAGPDAEAFVETVLGDEGRAILAASGFGLP